MNDTPAPTMIAYGIQQNWLDHGRIAFFQSPGGVSDEARRLWEHLVAKTVREWPDGQPILMIQDVTHPDSPIPRLARASELSHSMREGQVAYSAVVIGNNTVKRMLSRVTRLQNKTQSICHEQVFESSEAAYAWLQKVMMSQSPREIATAV